MADSNSNSAIPTAELGGVARTLNSSAINLAGLAHLLRMLMLDHGQDENLTASLTALAGIAERAGSDSLDAATTLEQIEAQTMGWHHA